MRNSSRKFITSSNLFRNTKLLALILLMLNVNLFGQSISTDLDSDFLQLRVKNIEDFINRFNYSQDARGNLLTYHDSLAGNRSKEILYMFSENLVNEYYTIDSIGNVIPDTSKYNILHEFISYTTKPNENKFLDLVDADWVAEADCDVTYLGKTEEIKLYLKLKNVEKHKGASWVIDSCKAPFFNTKPKEQVRISPVSHNMNFMHIAQVNKTNPADMAALADASFVFDELSVFFYELKQKRLMINSVSELKFHFHQIPNYYFVVEEILANKQHSGWLITKITETPKDSSLPMDVQAQ